MDVNAVIVRRAYDASNSGDLPGFAEFLRDRDKALQAAGLSLA